MMPMLSTLLLLVEEMGLALSTRSGSSAGLLEHISCTLFGECLMLSVMTTTFEYAYIRVVLVLVGGGSTIVARQIDCFQSIEYVHQSVEEMHQKHDLLILPKNYKQSLKKGDEKGLGWLNLSKNKSDVGSWSSPLLWRCLFLSSALARIFEREGFCDWMGASFLAERGQERREEAR